MKFLIVVAILTLAATASAKDSAVCVDTAVVHACVRRCGLDTVLLNENCNSVDLYWTDCMVTCTGTKEIGPTESSCVSLCELQEFLSTFGEC